MSRFTLEQVQAWLAESERLVNETTALHLVEQSVWSRKALNLAVFLRSVALARSLEVQRAS